MLAPCIVPGRVILFVRITACLLRRSVVGMVGKGCWFCQEFPGCVLWRARCPCIDGVETCQGVFSEML